MTIWLIVPNIQKIDEQKLRRLIEAVKQSKWIYSVEICFTGQIKDVSWMQKFNYILDEYSDNDLMFHYFWKDCEIEDNIKQVMTNTMHNYFCVMDPDVVMFQTFFHRMIDWFNDENYDIWMVCPRFTIGDKAYDGGVYFKPWQIIFMIHWSNVEKYICLTKEDFMNEKPVKVLRNCVCHYYGKHDDEMRSDNLACDLYL